MKKILTVLLVLTLSAVGLFADFIDSTKNTITLNATVPSAEPKFEISASMDEAFTTPTLGGNTLDTKKDPSAVAIDVYFKLKQKETARRNGKLLVKVTGVEFANGSNKTDIPSVEKVALTTGISDVEVSDISSTDAGVYKVELNYGAAVPKKAGDVLLLKYSWSANTNLPAETYTSTIKVEITETT